MPLYSYKCPSCDRVEVLMRRMSERWEPTICPQCGSTCSRNVSGELPVVRVFEPYYDECLHSDVYSESDRRSIMRLRGVTEAGDPVHGGRLFDPKAPMKVDKQPPKGIRPKISPPRDFPVEVIDRAGNTVNREMFSNLPNG